MPAIQKATASCTSGFTDYNDIRVNIVQFCCKVSQRIMSMYSRIFGKDIVNQILEACKCQLSFLKTGWRSQDLREHFVSGGVVPIHTPKRLRLCSFLLLFLAWQESLCSCQGWPGILDFATKHPTRGTRKAKMQRPRPYQGADADWKEVGLPGFPPRFGSSCSDWLQHCKDSV